MDLDAYKMRLRLQGTVQGEGREERMLNSARKNWEFNNPSFRTVDVLRNSGERDRVRINTAKRTVGVDRIFVHPDDTLAVGDIILSLQNTTWLVVEVKMVGHLYLQANLFIVNREIEWVAGGKKYSTLCRAKNFSRVDGTIEFYFLTMPENTIHIFIPLNEDTATITRDTRFFIDDLPYKVSRIDKFTYQGVATLYAKEDLIENTDKDGLANENELQDGATLEGIIGPSQIPHGGAANYSLTEDNVVWSILDQPSWAELFYEEQFVTVKFDFGSDKVGNTVVLQALFEKEGEVQELTKVIFVDSLV